MDNQDGKSELKALLKAALPREGYSGLVLAPGGRLFEIDEDEVVSNLSNQIISSLFAQVFIHPDFTIEDLFLLFSRNLASLGPVYTREHLSAWLEVFDSIKNGSLVTLPRATQEDGQEDSANSDSNAFEVVYVELEWSIHSLQGEERHDREIRTMIERGLAGEIKPKSVQILSVGGDDLDDMFAEMSRDREAKIREELARGEYWDNIKKSCWVSGTAFPGCSILIRKKGRKKLESNSMSFMPLQRLLPARLRLSEDFEMVRKDKERGWRVKYKNPSLTLGQLIQGFLWELSFYGSPTEVAKTARTVTASLEKAREAFKKSPDGE